MTVKELIDKLQEFDEDLEVICPENYEPNLIPVKGAWLFDNETVTKYYGKVIISGDY